MGISELVRPRGLEPLSVAGMEPKSIVYTSFTTGAYVSEEADDIYYNTFLPPPSRPCLKIGEMLDWGRFFRQARRFDAGILTDFKSNQRSPGGKRCLKTAFRHFSNKA